METSSNKFTLPDSDPPCEVHLPHNLTKDQLLNFPAFQNWLQAFRHNLSLQTNQDHTFHEDPYRLRAIEVESATWFSPHMLGFVKIQASVTTDTGGPHGWLPGAVFLRGRSVAMLVIYRNEIPNKRLADWVRSSSSLMTGTQTLKTRSTSFSLFSPVLPPHLSLWLSYPLVC